MRGPRRVERETSAASQGQAGRDGARRESSEQCTAPATAFILTAALQRPHELPHAGAHRSFKAVQRPISVGMLFVMKFPLKVLVIAAHADVWGRRIVRAEQQGEVTGRSESQVL